MKKSGASTEWNDLVCALEVRFGPTKFEDLTTALSKLQQVSSVQDYLAQFEALANRTKNLNEAFMISCFVGGLKEDIRLDVQMFKPTSLSAAIGLARL